MEKIVVIGSNAFSASSFIKHLREKDIKVIGVSRSEEPIYEMAPHRWTNKGEFYFYQLDINSDLSEIVKLIKTERPGYIVNYAAQSMVAQSWEHPEHWFETNVISTIKLHEELRKINFIKRYVHITTPEVYGSTQGSITETQPFNPSTPYAVSRACADMSIKTFFDVYNFPFVATRAANVYGPGQQLYRIIPKTVLSILKNEKIKLHGGGMSQRCFMFIDDVSNATWEIMMRGNLGKTYHISSDHLISIKDLVLKICNLMGKQFEDYVEPVEERLGKDAAYQLDSSKLRQELGWKNKTLLEDGLMKCIDWVDSNFETLSKAPDFYIHKP